MAVKELSVKEKLAQLHKLQQIDSKLDEIKVMKGELPMEVSDLEDDIAGLKTRAQRLDDTLADIDTEVNRHKANVKESEALIVRYQQQLDNVKNNREFDALNKEIELQRLEIQLSEKKTREASSSQGTKAETLGGINEKIAHRTKDLDLKKEELAGIIEKTEKEEEKLVKESEKARKDIEARLLKAYDKIRTSYRNGLAVAPISREACGGCFNKIPPQIQIEIGIMKNIVACEHCGRILVDEAFINE